MKTAHQHACNAAVYPHCTNARTPTTQQRQLLLVGRILPEFMNVLVVVALFVVFCAWFATTVFVGYERWHFFASISEACWTELVLLTRSNFLDVMIHAYARVSAITKLLNTQLRHCTA
jgi:hypothetical protein